MLERRGPPVLRAELAPCEAAVDCLAEDGRLPERERLEPAERPDPAPDSFLVARDELRLRRKALERRDRRDPERARAAARLRVCRQEVAEVGAGIADRAHLPVEDGLDAVGPLPR